MVKKYTYVMYGLTHKVHGKNTIAMKATISHLIDSGL